MKLKITSERVQEAAKNTPEARKVLQDLFPEAFEDNTPFCRIGSVFKRKGYPRNFYAVFQWNGEIRILNVSNNTFWDKERNIKCGRRENPENSYLTVSEFKSLSGRDDLSQFEFIES